MRQAIHKWRDGLVNLTGTNRLLNFKPSKTGMLIVARPTPGEVLAGARSGRAFGFRALQPDPPGPPGPNDEEAPYPQFPPSPNQLDIDRTHNDLGRIVRGLYRRSTQAYLDQGLSILYLAFGTLAWTDVDHTAYRSPLLLVPVRLETVGPKMLPILEPTEDDTIVNPALALKLEEFGIKLPAAETLDEAEGEAALNAFLSKVRLVVAGHKGWTVTDDLILSCFSFAKEAMYQDLLDNEDLIAAHETVQALALGAAGVAPSVTDRFAFDEIPDQDIDEKAPPEEVPLILDADSSQRACIAAALVGKSFVMDGPPGTGKSQTIANIIGVLLRAGKTVLFVSEKAAALDVVRDRLAARGLGAYLLELHSAKATRKEVAAELGRVLLTEQVPPRLTARMDARTALIRRNQLNQYADAMNRERDPFSRSLHDVLGQIALMHDVPVAPLPAIKPAELTVERYSGIMEAARALSRAWRPARQGASFPWREVTERGPMDFPLQQASSALATLFGTVAVNEQLAELTGLTRPSDAPALATILDHLAARPVVPGDWLTTDRLTRVDDAITRLDPLLTAITVAIDEATRAAGTTWEAIPQPDTLPDLPDLGTLFPRPRDVSDARPEEITTLAGQFRDSADMLANRAASLASLAGMLGLRPPVSFGEASDVASLVRLAELPLSPERLWLTPDGYTSAVGAVNALRAAADTLMAAEAAALTYYTPQAFNEDAAGLSARLAAHHGLGKMLSGEYRASKNTVATFTAPEISGDVAHQHLGLVVDWQNAARSYTAAEQAHAPALGRRYVGRSTDFTAIAQDLTVAETVLRLVRGQDTSRVADYLASPLDTAATNLAAVITQDLQSWRSARWTPPELASGTIADAIAWLRAQFEPLATIAAITRMVSDAVGQSLTTGKARALVTRRDQVDAAHERLAALAGDFDDLLGELYAGRQTDVPAVRIAYQWAARLRELVGGDAAVPLTEAQAKAMAAARMTPVLVKAATAWQSARDSLLAAFAADRRASLSAELDDYEEAEDLLGTLRHDPAGQGEWHAYQRNRAALELSVLGNAVAFCVGQRVPGEQVPAIMERALLQGWVEHVLRGEEALSIARAPERDALVAEYRKLDEALIENAVGDIISACNARRPRTDIGEPSVILREAEKKRKHMPVRTLLGRTRNAALAVKPCFMMSPLTVSQFLPPDMHFDVVIFDEASQVLPSDAINCVYRGSSLILAGDQKQLPPTSLMFGGLGADDEEEWSEDADDTAEFDSVLDFAKGAGVFRNLSLRWHRRSRHETLIAFSNFSFYDGKIITFPGAGGDGPDVGVEFFYVEDGVYRRGTSRDNQVEAARVAERVMHHYATRPGMSLGVVAFSEAQASAIETAVNAARAERPDLERYFNTDDRLHGFFVKNLETIQGDERDVLIFSIGYGPDENRRLTMNFGPLNKPGGWRRLNVAITRAHYRNEIVSSIRASDIRETTSEGIRHLRRYLDYAERGMAALALEVGPGGDAESPFEESVINVIRSWGYEVTPQVGTARYRIDIGVRHPDQPGAFCLGVECDGYQYHSSRAARDRDRLREEVLRGLGWRLHRIWGTAWYRDRDSAQDALRVAIERAAAMPVTGLLPAVAAAPPSAPLVITTRAAAFEETPAWVKPYESASVPRLLPWVDPGEAGNGYYMGEGIRQVVETEGPVHIDVLHARLRDAWDIGRIAKNIRHNIAIAITQAGVLRDGEFLVLPHTSVTVRTPTSTCKRTIAQVHDSELDLALRRLAGDAAGISADELTARVARIYGWERRGSDIAARLRDRITALLANGTLQGIPDSLTTPPSN